MKEILKSYEQKIINDPAENIEKNDLERMFHFIEYILVKVKNIFAEKKATKEKKNDVMDQVIHKHFNTDYKRFNEEEIVELDFQKLMDGKEIDISMYFDAVFDDLSILYDIKHLKFFKDILNNKFNRPVSNYDKSKFFKEINIRQFNSNIDKMRRMLFIKITKHYGGIKNIEELRELISLVKMGIYTPIGDDNKSITLLDIKQFKSIDEEFYNICKDIIINKKSS